MPNRRLEQRDDLRNVAIIAHVDHGKTTLVDAMLWQSGSFRENQDVAERVLDSMDLEREKGITILAKNTAVRLGGTKINIVDTPGHADFGGEVERGLTMVDGVLLLVDASEGPLPQTRFVLRKALEAKLPVVLVVNKVDRPDARPKEVVDEVYELFLDLDASEEQIEFPIVYSVAREGRAGLDPEELAANLMPLFDTLLDDDPAAVVRPGAPAAGARHEPRRQPVRRAARAAAHPARDASQGRSRSPGAARTGRSRTRARRSSTSPKRSTASPPRKPGRARSSRSRGCRTSRSARRSPIPTIRVRCPCRRSTSRASASRSGSTPRRSPAPRATRLTATQVKQRLDQELVGNVSLRVLPTARPDTWEVQGRGELQLAVLVELMRREGFELTVGKPEVLVREIDGKRHEPVERVAIDVPEEYVGVVTQLFALRKGRLQQMVNHGTGWARMEYLVTARGLIGFRTEFITETRGTGILHHVFDRWEPWHGELRARPTGSLVADRRGQATAFAIENLQERGSLFIAPTDELYEGMVVGENARRDDLDVNASKPKKLTNMRAAAADEYVRLIPPRPLSLEQAMEFIREDECVEVTPKSIRLRKVELSASARQSAASRRKRDAVVAAP